MNSKGPKRTWNRRRTKAMDRGEDPLNPMGWKGAWNTKSTKWIRGTNRGVDLLNSKSSKGAKGRREGARTGPMTEQSGRGGAG